MLFFWIVRTDITILKQFIVGKIINILFWTGSIVTISTFILPKLGMTKSYGEFIVVSSIVSSSYWGIWDASYKLVSDICGNRTISYRLALPLPSWLVIFQYAVKHAIDRSIPALIILPLYKLILWNRMDLSHFSLIKFIFIFTTISLFTGFFFLFISNFINNEHTVDTVGIRVLFPLWFFGASSYPWKIIYSMSPTLGYISLLNPVVYAMEGIHSAVLGANGYLPFWICAIVLWCLIIIFGYVGIARFKKRLDFV